MIQLRSMTSDDIVLGMRLKDLAGWNQTREDWQRFLTLQPDGCFVADWDGRPVGTTTTCVFGRIGWIAMVLVDPEFRGRGVGTRLMEHALDYLDATGVLTARLDATPLGRPVYERLGFVAEYDLIRMQAVGAKKAGRPEDFSTHHEPRPIGTAEHDAVLQLDKRVSGTERGRLLEMLLRERPGDSRVVIDSPGLSGYAMIREGSRALQIGPCMAETESAGRTLCDWAFSRGDGRGVFMDIPLDNQAGIAWAAKRGFQEQRRLTRMRRGPAVRDRPKFIWASSGPEKG